MPISELDRQNRRRAVASSEGSLAMEGQFLDDVSRELSRRYAEGELTLEDFGFMLEQHAREMAAHLSEKPLAVVA